MDNDDNEIEQSFVCPITGYPCKGDLFHLCEEYGCYVKNTAAVARAACRQSPTKISVEAPQ